MFKIYFIVLYYNIIMTETSNTTYFIPDPESMLSWVPLTPQQIDEFMSVKGMLDDYYSKAQMGSKKYGTVHATKYIFVIDVETNTYYIQLGDICYGMVQLERPYINILEINDPNSKVELTMGGFYKKRNTRSKRRKSSRKRY
jgi:hypothetical protein